MITKLNLASKPFRNRNLPHILALILLSISVAGALLCFARIRDNSRLNEVAVSEIRRMDDDTKRLNAEGEKIRQQLSPEQKTLLIAAHKLVANKSFGWSRLFADLEAVLPGNVSASRISVTNIYRDGDRQKAELEFAVLSRDYQAIAEMIQRMNDSGLFQAEVRGQDRQKTERSTYTEYTLRLIYTPAYGYSPVPTTDLAQTGGAR